MENEAIWADSLADLRRRELSGVSLVLSDDHEGMKAAIEKVFSSARWQRSEVHTLRRLSGRVPEKKRTATVSWPKATFEQVLPGEALRHRQFVAEIYRRAGLHDAGDSLRRCEDVLSYMEMPAAQWAKLHSTSALERLNRELKRRTRVVSIFPGCKALDRLVGALLLEEHEEWMAGRRHVSERSMNLPKTPAYQLDELVPGAGVLLANATEAHVRL